MSATRIRVQIAALSNAELRDLFGLLDEQFTGVADMLNAPAPSDPRALEARTFHKLAANMRNCRDLLTPS